MSKAGSADAIRKYTRILGRDARPEPATDASLAAMGIRIEHVPAKEKT